MEKEYIKGGAFLIEDRTPAEIFTPEDFTEEHRMIAETTRQFIDNEVVPQSAALEKHDWEVARELVEKGGDLGLDRREHSRRIRRARSRSDDRRVIAENIGPRRRFATTLGARDVIGLLPIIYFGTEEPKQK